MDGNIAFCLLSKHITNFNYTKTIKDRHELSDISNAIDVCGDERFYNHPCSELIFSF